MKKNLNHYTQEFCNAILDRQIDPDGRIGKESYISMELCLHVLEKYCRKNNIEWKKEMFFAIRMDDEFKNKFNDWGILKKGHSFLAFPMSTKPGWSYVKNKQWVDKVKGVLCLAPGHYKKLWTIGKSSWTGAKHLIQVGKIKIFRDSNLDEKIDKTSVFIVGPEVGMNFHSWKNFILTLVQNLSAGCQVVQYNILLMIWPYIEEMAKNNEGFIDYTLIQINDLYE